MRLIDYEGGWDVNYEASGTSQLETVEKP